MIQKYIKKWQSTLLTFYTKVRLRPQKSNAYLGKEAFYEKIAYLLSAQVSLSQTLFIMKEDGIRDECEQGRALSGILHDKKVARSIVSRIRQGEKTGSLALACSDIARTLRIQRDIHNKMTMSLVYPAVLLVATGGIVIFLVMYIFPKMMPLFISMKVKLPMTTRMVMWLSTHIQSDWVYILVCLSVIISFIYKYRDPILLHTPLLNSWYRAQKITQHFGRIASYIESGIGLDAACRECRDMEQSGQFKYALGRIADQVTQGISFAEALKKEYMYPRDIADMVMIGESSGRLADMCKKIAELYEQKFSEYTKMITTSVEPLSMLVMGGVVGFVALSMITPLYSITEHVR